MVSERVKTAVYIGAAAAGIGIVGYVAYSFTQAQTKGGSCTTPGTPCYNAIQPYVQLEQQCANEYAALMAQIVQSGNAPTSAQQAQLQTFQQCMNDAANNIAKLVGQFVDPTFFDQALQDIFEIVLVVAVTYYGLKGLGSFINTLRSRGQITTKPGSGAGIAAVMFDATIQLAASSNLLSSTQIAAWQLSVQDFASVDIGYVSSFYNTLVSESVIDSALANSLITEYSGEINSDATSTINALTPLLGYGCGTCF